MDLREYILAKAFFWLGTAVTIADLIAWGTGFVGIFSTILMCGAAWYARSNKIKESRIKDIELETSQITLEMAQIELKRKKEEEKS